ncbi:MAG: histidine kinase dimerization/phosphoacceptor domain -containing protein, partial [Spirochaetota bacterium]
MKKLKQPSLYPAFRIAALYVVFAGLWVLFSDRILDAFFRHSSNAVFFQTFKGWVFVLVTGVLLFVERKISQEWIIHRQKQEDAFIEQSSEGIVITDYTGRVVMWNSAAARMSGISKAEVLGKMAVDLPLTAFSLGSKGLSRTVVQEMLSFGSPAWIKCDDITISCENGKSHLELTVFVVKGMKGYSLGAIVHDVTERRQAEEKLASSVREKNLLLKEVHHRVKNNLQIIISLLRLQGNTISGEQELSAFRDSSTRIRVISMIHEGLYQSVDLSRIYFPGFIRKLIAELPSYLGVSSSSFPIVQDYDDLCFPIDIAVPCGLLLSELLTRSFKRAGRTGKPCEIKITLHQKGSRIILRVSDSLSAVPDSAEMEKDLGLE